MNKEAINTKRIDQKKIKTQKHGPKMAGKTAKLNCTLTSTTTTKTTDTNRFEDGAKLLSHEHWSTEKSV